MDTDIIGTMKYNPFEEGWNPVTCGNIVGCGGHYVGQINQEQKDKYFMFPLLSETKSVDPIEVDKLH